MTSSRLDRSAPQPPLFASEATPSPRRGRPPGPGPAVRAPRPSPAPVKLQLGAKLTKGLGAGSNPDVGREAAQEDPEQVTRLLGGADMVFITAGLGGGTGTGAAPVVASLPQELRL